MSLQQLFSMSVFALYMMACFDNKPEDDEDDDDETEVLAEGSTQGDCFDGIDNDGDGDVDCNDSGCANKLSVKMMNMKILLVI